MLCDAFGRAITYLRISVTDRCNYRCHYCMSKPDIVFKPESAILCYEEIARIADAAGRMGFRKIKLTGGEPLVRKDVEHLVARIAQTGWYEDIGMTTNGSLLTYDKARALKTAGLHRITISLDTLDKATFFRITRGGDIRDIHRAIHAAQDGNLDPIKINMVVDESTAVSDIEAMRAFCAENRLTLQTISLFSLHCRSNRRGMPHRTDRPTTCIACNRLRLTADGYFKPCLFSDPEIKADLKDPESSIMQAVSEKPQNGVACSIRSMNQIGG